MHKLIKKPITLGLPIETYELVRNVALQSLLPYESAGGALQRWIVGAINERLKRDGAGMSGTLPIPRHAAPGSIEEAVERIAHLKTIVEKPGQYPPVKARKEEELAAWEQELADRRKPRGARQEDENTPAPCSIEAIERNLRAAEDRGEYSGYVRQYLGELGAKLQKLGLERGTPPWRAFVESAVERHRIGGDRSARRAAEIELELGSKVTPKVVEAVEEQLQEMNEREGFADEPNYREVGEDII